jgi:ABC-2 type transport system permease protein
VTSRAFLFGAIGTPLILLAIWAFGGGFTTGVPDEEPFQDLEEAASEKRVIGYVDRAGLIEEIPDPVPEGTFVRYDTLDAAEAALEQEDIEAYYVVPENYPQNGEIERVSPRFPTAPPDAQTFNWVLVNNLFPEADQEQIQQLRYPLGGTGPAFVSTVTSEEDGGEGGISMLPFVVTIAVMLPLFTGGGYLFQSLAQEKSSRVMELLLVSLRPRQLLTGKLLGLAALVLVQYAIWVAIAGVALVVTGQGVGQLLVGIQLSATEVLLVIPYALGGFGLYAALMAGIGALTEDVEGSRGWIFVLTLPMMIPLYLWTAIANAPNGPLALILSLFPYSAPVAMLMRMTASAVPPWQLTMSLGLLLVAVVGTIWLMARLFRAQTLLSGEPLSLSRFWTALRS